MHGVQKKATACTPALPPVPRLGSPQPGHTATGAGKQQTAGTISAACGPPGNPTAVQYSAGRRDFQLESRGCHNSFGLIQIPGFSALRLSRTPTAGGGHHRPATSSAAAGKNGTMPVPYRPRKAHVPRHGPLQEKKTTPAPADESGWQGWCTVGCPVPPGCVTTTGYRAAGVG